MSSDTQTVGSLTHPPENRIHFPEGIPAFEEEYDFIRLSNTEAAPLILLQSTRHEELIFVTVEVSVLIAGYCLQLEAEHLTLLGWTEEREPRMPEELLCLAILTLSDQPTANLLSPVVINRANRMACQVIQTGSPYSCRHPLSEPAKVETTCS